VACRADTSHEFRLEKPAESEIAIDVEGAGASGRAEVYRA
jgi:hypothetical protein